MPVNEPLTVLVKYHCAALPPLEKLPQGDWVDLRAAEDVSLKAGDHYYVSLGISVRLPEGYELWIAPRSSTFRNFGVLQPNSPAIVDESYSSDEDVLRYPVLAMRDTEIHVGDRLCQCRLMPHQSELRFEAVESLGHKARGGFGSTGIQ